MALSGFVESILFSAKLREEKLGVITLSRDAESLDKGYFFPSVIFQSFNIFPLTFPLFISPTNHVFFDNQRMERARIYRWTRK